MPLETALAYIRGATADRRIPPVVVIFGPHAFLREYVLDSIVRKLAAEGCQYRRFQIGSGDDYVLLDRVQFAPAPDYVLRVKGDSMRDEGIFDGDLIANFTEKPQIGEGWINGGFLVLEPQKHYLETYSMVLNWPEAVK